VTGTEIELSRQVQKAVAFWEPSQMLPSSYRKDGVVDLVSLRLAADRLETLGLDPYANLGDTFVIAGQVGLSAALQRALLERVGYLILFDSVDDVHAAGRVQFPDGRVTPALTIRIDDTDIAAYAKKNPTNYDTKPRRMLEARLSTELISLYASAVLRGIIGAAGVTDIRIDDTPAPRPAFAPDGSTIPEADREPPIDPTVRAGLAARIGDLDSDARAALLEAWRDLQIPPLGSHRLTRAHGALISRLIDEAAPAGTPTPAAVHDDTPESRGYQDAEVDPQTGEILDPARPFTNGRLGAES
jgi:hypothetical protein